MDAQELEHSLRMFTGTEEWFRYPLNRNMLFTDGVKFFADNAGGGAYWFLDIVATEHMPLQMAGEEFMVIKLKVEGSKATITTEDGNDRVLTQRRIDYTDCPEGEWTFYLVDGTLLLPSEY